MKLAITGRPGSGKTTLCKRLIESLDLRVGGILTDEVRDHRGRRLGFELLDVATGEVGTLAHVDLKTGPRVGKYHVNVGDIERIAIPALDRALSEAELTVIDEIAPMELKCRGFVDVVGRVLDGRRPLVVSFKQHLRHPLVERVRQTCQLYEITGENRERLFRELLGVLSTVS